MEESPDSSAKWNPNIHASTWNPSWLIAVNTSPATTIYTKCLETLDFSGYIQTFTGSLFLPTDFNDGLCSSASQILTLNEVNISVYREYFISRLTQEFDARAQEDASYNMFKVNIHPYNLQNTYNLYTLQVPGLREDTPRVMLGDTIFLRQLLIDSMTQLPLANAWTTHPGTTPGFTGVQQAAIISAISKAREILILKIDGTLQSPLIFNVIFPLQERIKSLLCRAVVDIDKELSIGVWLKRMLFPFYTDGVETTSLPSANFRQSFFDTQLNYEQKKAVDAIQSQRYGNVPYLISGPPGTGKTKTIVEAILQIVNDPKCAGRALVCAPSDQAADLLALRLQQWLPKSALLRLNRFSRTFEEVPDTLLPQCYIENNYFSLPPFDQLMSFKVVVSSCRDANILVEAKVTNRNLTTLQHNLATSINPDSINLRAMSYPLHWTALLVDEAAQAIEPEILVPLSVVAPPKHIRAHPDPIFIMAGDQHQLGPKISSDLSTLSLHVSLFERLAKLPFYAAHPLFHCSAYQGRVLPFPMLQPAFTNLIRNYRSHPAILAVPSAQFYNDSLIPEAPSKSIDGLLPWPYWPRSGWPVLFSVNNGLDMLEDVISNAGSGSGWYNLSEARKATLYAQKLLQSNLVQQKDICIMAPSGAQVRLIRKSCRAAKLYEVNIGPMEAFQGLEKEVVIICTTRARKSFLEEDRKKGFGMVGQPKKINVAITRAKQGLIVIGNPWVLEVDDTWQAFMAFCWRNGCWRDEEDDSYTFKGDVGGEGERSGLWRPQEESKNISGLEKGLNFRDTNFGLNMEAGGQEDVETDVGTDNFIGRRKGQARNFLTKWQDDPMWVSGRAAEASLGLQ